MGEGGQKVGEGGQKVQTSRYKIGKSENAVNSMLTTVNNTVLHIWKLLSESHSVVSNSLRPHGILQARILKRVAFPFSRGSSQPRDQTQVSHIAGGFFTSWATREAWICSYASVILLLIPSSVLFISVCLFFSSFRSLVNVFCIFSVLFLKSWIIFTNIILNSFSGRLHISTCSRWWNRRMCAHLLLGDHQNCN